MTKKYYRVLTKCGHVGRNGYVPIQFAIVAETGKEAAKIARDMPRVKHHHKDAILKVEEISKSIYKEIREINANDPYLHCHSIQEQNEICDLADRIVREKKEEICNNSDRKNRLEYMDKKRKAIRKSDLREMREYGYCY